MTIVTPHQHDTETQPISRVDDAGNRPRRAKVILIEFNELCPPLLDRFMADGKLPNFKALHDSSQVFVTQADVDDPRYLEPWIQWYSLHTGLSFDQHGVYHLTDGPAAGHVDIWQALLASGKTVGSCGSMNVKGFDRPGSFFIPDPWCTSEPASPADLQVFHRIVARQVQEYSNGGGAGIGDAAAFLCFMLGHGLSAGTVAAGLRQLAHERFVDPKSTWQRVGLLDRLQFDLFRHLYRRYRPDFATFFANSTAHLQHAYWRFMEPEAFTVRPEDEELARLEHAVLFGYRQMDALIGQFRALAGPDAMLILASALSQQPHLKSENIGGQHFYRPHKVEKMLADLGVAFDKVVPVMTHQYLIHFRDNAARDAGRQILASYRLDGEAVFGFDASQDGTLYFGNQVRTVVPEGATIAVDGAPARSHRFYDLFYQIPEIKSGRHHPDGVLWVMTGRHQRHPVKISVLDVFPTLLDLFDVALPAGAEGLYRGRSALPAMAWG